MIFSLNVYFLLSWQTLYASKSIPGGNALSNYIEPNG